MTSAGASLSQYLESSEVIDWKHPAVLRRARELSSGLKDPVAITKRCFEWVRDEIKHSNDFKMSPTTCSASEALLGGTGYCFAKSHLLAALLRANGIPAGLCYQRLSIDGTTPRFSLHGLNAAYLPEIGWYRIDPRGNKEGVNAQFTPPVEQLAWPIAIAGETDLPEIWSEPLPVIVQALRTYHTYDAVLADLPDINLIPGWTGKREAIM